MLKEDRLARRVQEGIVGNDRTTIAPQASNHCKQGLKKTIFRERYNKRSFSMIGKRISENDRLVTGKRNR